MWTPRRPSKPCAGFTDIVMEVMRNKQDLLERQQRLRSRIMATQQVLKVQREEMAAMSDEDGEEDSTVQEAAAEKKKKWQRAIKKVMEDNTKAKKKPSKRSIHFHDVVSQYVATMSTSSHDDATVDQFTVTQAKAEARNSLRQWRSQYMESTKQKKKNPMKQSSSVPIIPMHATVQHEMCPTIPEESGPTEDSRV